MPPDDRLLKVKTYNEEENRANSPMFVRPYLDEDGVTFLATVSTSFLLVRNDNHISLHEKVYKFGVKG